MLAAYNILCGPERVEENIIQKRNEKIAWRIAYIKLQLRNLLFVEFMKNGGFQDLHIYRRKQISGTIHSLL